MTGTDLKSDCRLGNMVHTFSSGFLHRGSSYETCLADEQLAQRIPHVKESFTVIIVLY
ncbi:12515_t:CDS:2 [Acaulospora morrowiae]|uniref:12515_t:CDS:1 n=1 Tax=Acaulospora morrowiae TaxID=94023 RepID=A0A9N8YW36_9GLOM|nr:12515_t:CDS:2 [Acaulospora morrowiae]